MRWFRWLLVTGCLLLAVTGCGEQPVAIVDTEPTVPPPSPTAVIPTTEPEPVEEPPLFPYTTALTGLGVNELEEGRPHVVMIENSPSARPQSGLHLADIVYEILAEGEITRFVAVYQSEQPEIIGPVRSIRPYFVEIGDELDALIVHAGWSQDAMNKIVALRANTLDGVYAEHPYFWRSSERRMPNNLYTSYELIHEGAEAKRYRCDEWDDVDIVFGAESALTDYPHASASVSYLRGYKVTYTYDEEQQYYLRHMAGSQHLDKETETPLIAHNVLVLETYHKILDSEGRRDVDIYGPGDGYILQNGQGAQITWKLQDGFVRVHDEDGQEIPLIPGKTWIQYVTFGTEIEFE